MEKRMSNSRKGRIITKEWMEKILTTRMEKGVGKGEKNGMYGKTGRDHPTSKPIVMLSRKDGSVIKEFECIREANDYFDKSRASSLVSRVCVQKRGTAYGYKWLFKEDYEDLINNNEFEAWLGQKLRKMNKDEIRGKEVYMLKSDTLEVVNKYNNISEASDKTNVLSSGISRCCRHGCNTAGGYSWIFVDEYNELDKEEICKLYARKTKPIPKEAHFKKSVICSNTHEIFDSVKSASQIYNIDASSISRCCKGNGKSAGKHLETGEPLRWIYYDDYLKLYNESNNIKLIHNTVS